MKFGFLHVIATDLCIWSITVVLEAAETFIHSTHGSGSSGDPYTSGPIEMTTPIEYMNHSHHIQKRASESISGQSYTW